MMMLRAMRGAMLDAMPRAYANGNARQAMHGRTDGRTNEELTHVTYKSSRKLTRTRKSDLHVLATA